MFVSVALVVAVLSTPAEAPLFAPALAGCQHRYFFSQCGWTGSEALCIQMQLQFHVVGVVLQP
jgi:hypothetical protein